MRLAFLRQTQADPLDVPSNRDSLGIDGLLWRDGNASGAYTLTDRWNQFLVGANRALLGGLYAAARSVAPALPLLVRQCHDANIGLGWYGSWDDPRKPPPTYRLPQDQAPLGTPAPAPPPARDVQSRSLSRFSLMLMPGWPYGSASELAQDLRDQVGQQHWSGFVLDFTQGAPEAQGDPLARLARSLSFPASPRP